jgi:hypothetical protein
MELVLHDALLQKLARAIEQVRPEIFGVHTKRYKNKIPHPWNTNESQDPIQLKALKAEVDYEARGSKVTFRIGAGHMLVSLNIDAAIMRSAAAGSIENGFSQTAELTSLFGDLAGGAFPFLVTEAQFTTLQPVGIRMLLSWIIANSIDRSFEGLGIPETIALGPNALLRLQKPVFAAGALRLTAKLEV